MSFPIRVRITAMYGVFLALILVAVGSFVVVRLRSDLTHATDRTLNHAVDQIAEGYHAEGPKDFRDVAATVLAGERAAAQVLDPSGRVMVSFGDRIGRQPMLGGRELQSAVAGSRITQNATFSAAGFRMIARPVARNGRRQVVVAASSLSPIRRSVRRVLILLVLAFPVALAATAFAGWWLARRALRPIDHMTSTAAAIGPDRLQERVPVPRTADEVAHLARTLNTMLDRIQAGVEAQRRLVADTSHELRTPLTVMRTEFDVSLRSDELSPSARAALESAREEVDRMNVTIEDLLTLAHADEGRLGLQPEAVDLYEVAFDAVASLSGLARARGVDLRLDGSSAAVHADADRLRQVLRNLVDNAIKFSPEGGQVAVEAWSAPGEAGVTVSDEGPGIPAELHERIFERFFRVDASRTRSTGGNGLGLAIAGELVGAHGGRIAVENREPHGATFTVVLPSPGADGHDDSEPISHTAWPLPVAAAPRGEPGNSRRTAR